MFSKKAFAVKLPNLTHKALQKARFIKKISI
jgi:hypothetical protein